MDHFYKSLNFTTYEDGKLICNIVTTFLRLKYGLFEHVRGSLGNLRFSYLKVNALEPFHQSNLFLVSVKADSIQESR